MQEQGLLQPCGWRKLSYKKHQWLEERDPSKAPMGFSLGNKDPH